MENMYIFWGKNERSLQEHSIKGEGVAYCGLEAATAMDMTVTWCIAGKLKVELAHRVAYILHKKLTELPRTNNAGDEWISAVSVMRNFA